MQLAGMPVCRSYWGESIRFWDTVINLPEVLCYFVVESVLWLRRRRLVVDARVVAFIFQIVTSWPRAELRQLAAATLSWWRPYTEAEWDARDKAELFCLRTRFWSRLCYYRSSHSGDSTHSCLASGNEHPKAVRGDGKYRSKNDGPNSRAEKRRHYRAKSWWCCFKRCCFVSRSAVLNFQSSPVSAAVKTILCAPLLMWSIGASAR